MEDIKDILSVCAAKQLERVTAWHEPGSSGPNASPESILELVEVQHRVNFDLWHTEDEARRKDVDDRHIADCKRAIDGLNQRRNDLIERVDGELARRIDPRLPKGTPQRHNTETLGSVLDRLSIMALKVYHMQVEAERESASVEQRDECRAKLERLRAQRDALLASGMDVLDDYAQGRKRPFVNRQFKMYNDPRLNPALYSSQNGE